MQEALNDVSNILWRERQMLELLVFKLEEEQLVLASGRTRWLQHATREVETVLGEIKRMELDRSVHVEGLGASLGIESNPSLRQLGELAPEPWGKIFQEHRRALMDLTLEIDGVAKANRDILTRGQLATREALAAMGDAELDSYAPNGALVGDRGMNARRLIDEAM